MAALLCEWVEVRDLGALRGRALFAKKDFAAGEEILRECPLVAAQFCWNKSCKYRACNACLRSLETATEMARRLSGIADLELPHNEFEEHVVPCQCPRCGVEYCSESCRVTALQQHHALLCTGGDKEHILCHIEESWKTIHHPPESTSITLILRLLACCLQAPRDEDVVVFADFCSVYARVAGDKVVRHVLLSPKFQPQIEAMLSWTGSFFASLQHPHFARIQQWLTPEGFRSLLAMLGTNATGIGTSSIALYDKRLTAAPLDPGDREQTDNTLDNLYDMMEEESGGFLDVEGSGLYRLQSTCNHSCRPNAENTFPENSFVLHLMATKNIRAGEEITISYLDEDQLSKSRNFRRHYLATNYLFECACPKCQEQIGHSDESDEEEEEDDDEEEEDENGAAGMEEEEGEGEEEEEQGSKDAAAGAAASTAGGKAQPAMRVIHSLREEDEMIFDDADLEA